MDKISICHLYPDLLNLYGDRGNIIAMQKRLEWRGIGVELDEISIGMNFDPDKYDIVFIGGGQDFEQEILLKDLDHEKTSKIKYAVDSNVVFLGICGGYQLLGTHYISSSNIQYDFIGALDVHTRGLEERMVGDYLFEIKNKDNQTYTVVGFENHSGATFLGETVKPLGKILKGYGNNGNDKTEGAHYKNVFCSYSHGPLLPRNPLLNDIILKTALDRKYGAYTLENIDDSIENRAREIIIKRLLYSRRLLLL